MAEPAGHAPPRVGPGRVLVGLYALFVVAAGSRSAVQLITHPHRALLAYVLSGVAAGVYAVGLALVVRAERGDDARRRRAAGAWCVLELAAVLAVGTLTVLRPDAFREPTVWSGYGVGYLLVPVVLPVLVLTRLHRAHRRRAVIRRRPRRSGSTPASDRRRSGGRTR